MTRASEAIATNQRYARDFQGIASRPRRLCSSDRSSVMQRVSTGVQVTDRRCDEMDII
jgi:hypothetical protein